MLTGGCQQLSKKSDRRSYMAPVGLSIVIDDCTMLGWPVTVLINRLWFSCGLAVIYLPRLPLLPRR